MRKNVLINTYKENRILLFILLLGVCLRLWYIDWGLPELFEEATPLTISWKFWNWGNPGFNFNPQFFNYPALTFYIQFIAQVIHFVIGNILGIYPNINSFGVSPSPLVITARLVDVMFDLLTILMVYKIAIEIWDKKTALIASFLLVLNPLHISLAHQIQVDTILTFFCISSLLYTYRIYKSGDRKSYIFAGILISLAAASKYTGAFLLFAMIGAHLLRKNSFKEMIRSLNDPALYISIFIFIIIFLLLNPFILLNSEKFQKDFSFEQAHIATGHLGIVSSKSTFDFYFLNVLPSALGVVGLLLCIGQIIYLIIKRKKDELVLLLFPVFYFIIISTWEMRAERYILPIIPYLILITSSAVKNVVDRIIENIFLKREWLSKDKLSYAIIIILLIIQPIFITYNYLYKLGLPDTRTITKNWIRDNIPSGSIIATGPYGIDFPDSSYKIIEIPFIAVYSELAAPFYDTRWYTDTDLLIASSFDRDRYAMEPERYKEFLMYYDSLTLKWKKVFEAIPDKKHTGPSLWLFTPPDSVKRSKFDLSLFERLDGNPESTRISNFLKNINEILIQKKQLAKSEQILRLIIMNEGTNIKARNQLAKILYEQGNYAGALNQLQHSIQIDRNQPEVFALAGKTLIILNKLPEGEAALNTALVMDSRLTSAYQDLIEFYTRQNERQKLLDILKRYYGILYPRTEEAIKIKERIDSLKKVLEN